MSRMVEVRPGCWAHASGALWLSDAGTVIIADAHLGYSWALRRRGQLGPLADEAAAAKVLALVEELKPTRVVFLGDLVHAPKPAPGERKLVESTLSALARSAEVLLVGGNHDRGFARDFGHLGVLPAAAWQWQDVVAIHGDKLPPSPAEHYLVMGHFHPSLRIRDNAGAKHRFPVFMHTRRCLLLPAFSPYAAGWDLARGYPEALTPWLRGQPRTLIAVTGKRAVVLMKKEASGPSDDDAAEQS